jgi:YVTN family beta-propeller protein
VTPSRLLALVALGVTVAGGCGTPSRFAARTDRDGAERLSLPTGKRLDPVGRTIELGNMPLAVTVAPDGRHAAVALSGWRQQGIQIIDLDGQGVAQSLPQAGAFLGLAFAPDGRSLYVSGAATDLVYRYTWNGGRATLSDSISLRDGVAGDAGASRFLAGIALAPDGKRLYVAENMADSLAVVDLATRRVVQRLPTDHYPYAVVAGPGGEIFVSGWGGTTVSVYRSLSDDRLAPDARIEVGRHPSALLLNSAGDRLFAASSSTDRVAVVDVRARRVIAVLADSAPSGPDEGSTPDALALSPDGGRLFIAEADNNAVAVYDLSGASAGHPTGRSVDSLIARLPTYWYPSALAMAGDSLLIVSGKGKGTGPNPRGPRPGEPLEGADYILGKMNGTVSVIAGEQSGERLTALTRRVHAANGWDADSSARAYPPFEHVILIIKEIRTYDQVLGDLPGGDGDSTLLFFPRPISPNHHALAERFGLFDRFFVNAEVSAQGHPWSTAAYVTEYIEKTAPLVYADKRPEVNEAGEVDEPAAGWLWTAALRKGLTVRNYGEYAEPLPGSGQNGASVRYTSRMPGLGPITSPDYPPFNMKISDQRRVDVWIGELERFAAEGRMPALEIMHLPNDHLAATRPGYCAPRACMADNDLALGRLVEALSRSPFWKNTALFALEDDAQAGPDHVDAHRSVLFAISAYSRPAPIHRFVNTTDVLATIEEILGLTALSQFDRYGRPLRGIWSRTPDLRPYQPIVPTQSLLELNIADGVDARASRRLDLARADRIDDAAYNRILWRAVKGPATPYPRPRRMSVLDIARNR